jgi:uncharacterized protein YjbJ (UPF0337 family)
LDVSTSDRDRLRGKAKERVGRLTGDEELEEQGRTDQAKADFKERTADAKAQVKGTFEGAKEAVTRRDDDR